MNDSNYKQGLRCYILRADNFPDCSMNGVSSRVHAVTLVGPGIPKVFDATDDAPAVVLTEITRGYVAATPLEVLLRHEQAMAGGTFIWTSDSRFPCDYPLSLYDRVEHAAPTKEATARCAGCPGGPRCEGGDPLGSTYYCERGYFFADGDAPINQPDGEK